MPDGPNDPFSELAAGAIALREMYNSLRAADFSKSEALYLVGVVMTNAANPKGEKP